jgi:hypothetical protein
MTFVSWFNLQSNKEKQEIPCPVCKATRCYKHCNNCGKDIRFKFRDNKWVCLDSETESVHKCMKDGTKSGKFLDVNKKRSGSCPICQNPNYRGGTAICRCGYQEKAPDFYNQFVVQDTDNVFVRAKKIARWKKLTGYDDKSGTTYAERSLVQGGTEFTFDLELRND